MAPCDRVTTTSSICWWGLTKRLHVISKCFLGVGPPSPFEKHSSALFFLVERKLKSRLGLRSKVKNREQNVHSNNYIISYYLTTCNIESNFFVVSILYLLTFSRIDMHRAYMTFSFFLFSFWCLIYF